MSNQLYHLYPSDLTNRQWESIEDLIPPAKEGGRPRTLDMRLVINAMLYVLMGGIQWRMLPLADVAAGGCCRWRMLPLADVAAGGCCRWRMLPLADVAAGGCCRWRMLPRDYPNWKSVYHYFRAWRKDGTWQRLHDTLRALVRRKAGKHKHPTAGCLDSQSVKCSHIKGVRGFDNGKKINGRKRHVLVDTLGLLLAVLVTTADISDPAGARLLLSWLSGRGKELRRIWVDGTYRGTLLDWVSARFRFVLHPVLRSDDQKGFVLLPKRWIVERTFGWLGHCRRLSKDYEELTHTGEAWVLLAMIRLMTNRL